MGSVVIAGSGSRRDGCSEKRDEEVYVEEDG